MFLVTERRGNLWGVLDTKDGVIEYYDADTLIQYKQSGIEIAGVLSKDLIAPVNVTKAGKIIYGGEKIGESRPIFIYDTRVRRKVYPYPKTDSERMHNKLCETGENGIIGVSYKISASDDNFEMTEINAFNVVDDVVSYYTKKEDKVFSTKGYCCRCPRASSDLCPLSDYFYLEADLSCWGVPNRRFIPLEVVATSSDIFIRYVKSLKSVARFDIRGDEYTFSAISRISLNELLLKYNIDFELYHIDGDDIHIKTPKGYFKISKTAYMTIYGHNIPKELKIKALKMKFSGEDISLMTENGTVKKIAPSNVVNEIESADYIIPEGAVVLERHCLNITTMHSMLHTPSTLKKVDDAFIYSKAVAYSIGGTIRSADDWYFGVCSNGTKPAVIANIIKAGMGWLSAIPLSVQGGKLYSNAIPPFTRLYLKADSSHFKEELLGYLCCRASVITRGDLQYWELENNICEAYGHCIDWNFDLVAYLMEGLLRLVGDNFRFLSKPFRIKSNALSRGMITEFAVYRYNILSCGVDNYVLDKVMYADISEMFSLTTYDRYEGFVQYFRHLYYILHKLCDTNNPRQVEIRSRYHDLVRKYGEFATKVVDMMCEQYNEPVTYRTNDFDKGELEKYRRRWNIRFESLLSK